MKAVLNRETGIVDVPIHPCYKAPDKGLCKLRVDGGSEFECCREPMGCRYFKRIEPQTNMG